MRRPAALPAFAALLSACVVSSPPAGAGPKFVVTPVAERSVDALPEGKLFWHVERFASRALAEQDASAMALIADDLSGTWRFTIRPSAEPRTSGGLVAVIGPIPIIPAKRYLLRVNRAGGPKGARTEVHSHPGSEAFIVRSGRLCQRMDHGTACVDAGETRNGHGAGQAMQLWSAGDQPLDQFVLFVVDADRPFSSPERFR